MAQTSNMAIPYFSIIIPSYNRAELLPRAIQSVLDQSFQNFELVIVDDGSTDNTENVMLNYHGDERIRYVRQANKGVCAARNTGGRVATGLYLTFLDSDDFVNKEWLFEFYTTLESGSYYIAFCYSALMDDLTKKVIHIDSFSSCNTKIGKVKYSSLAGTFFIKKFLFEMAGGYNEQLKYSENTEFITRVLFHQNPMAGYIPKILITFGNSLDPKMRRGKFSQSLMRTSLEALIAINLDYWQYNKNQLVFSVRRIIVANIVLSDYWRGFTTLSKYFHLSPMRFMKLLALFFIAPVYRKYLLSLGFRR